MRPLQKTRKHQRKVLNLKKAATTVVLGDCNGQSNPSIQEGKGNYLQVSAAYFRGCDVTGMPVAPGQVNGVKCTGARRLL
ncbi:hypothetical protein RRG08_026450 [Elysia crispata]|uniref:Uncharacterized protein n=1 Tax=Elysia crispata TaxID=231223 RepID=A0AAE0Y3V5_9GAST|nr:hypothetical protein RRG08_026450 [Elysia crispata]